MEYVTPDDGTSIKALLRAGDPGKTLSTDANDVYNQHHMTLFRTSGLIRHPRSRGGLLILGLLLCIAGIQGCPSGVTAPMDPEPGMNPDPTDDPEPGTDPDPIDDPEPGTDPDPIDDPEPGTDPDPIDDPVVIPRLLLGVNEGGVFRELQNGDDIGVHLGGQGGIHVFLSLRGEGVERRDFLLVGQTLTFVDENMLAAPDLELPTFSFQERDGNIEFLDYFISLSGSQNTVRDRLVRVEMSLRDPNDETFNYSASVLLRFVDAS